MITLSVHKYKETYHLRLELKLNKSIASEEIVQKS